MIKSYLIINVFLAACACSPLFAWTWNTAGDEAILPSLKEDLDKEKIAYRQQVGNGLSLRDRIIALDRMIDNYKPFGLNVAELEIERSRVALQEKQQELRASEAQGEATALYDRGVVEYRQGHFQTSMNTFREAERLLPKDETIKEIRKKLESITSIIEVETNPRREGQLIRLAVVRYLENDPKRALNALVYANNQKMNRPELIRLQRLIESNHPEVEAPHLGPGINLVDQKLQSSLEAIYDGRYLTAITECTEILDLEPDNVLALTRLGSAYFAMNEKDKARQIWTKALQIDPKNTVLRKFLYGSKGQNRVERTAR